MARLDGLKQRSDEWIGQTMDPRFRGDDKLGVRTVITNYTLSSRCSRSQLLTTDW